MSGSTREMIQNVKAKNTVARKTPCPPVEIFMGCVMQRKQIDLLAV